MSIEDLIKDVDISERESGPFNVRAINDELHEMFTICNNIKDGEENESTDLYKDSSGLISGIDFISSELCIKGRPKVIKDLKVEPESYKTLVLSTSHYTFEDNDDLEELATDSDMLMSRQYGFYIKLYNEAELNDKPCLSDECRYILRWALENGYRAVEFDCDAGVYEGLFPKFEW